jgi:hypothetical protein
MDSADFLTIRCHDCGMIKNTSDKKLWFKPTEGVASGWLWQKA